MDSQRAEVLENPASIASRVATDSAAGYCTVARPNIDSAAIMVGEVVAHCDAGDCQHAAAIAVDSAAGKRRRVPGYDARHERQAFFVVDAAAAAVRVAARQQQAHDFDVDQRKKFAIVDVEHPAAIAVVPRRRRIVARGIDREQIGPGTANRRRIGNPQFAVREQNRRRPAAGQRGQT